MASKMNTNNAAATKSFRDDENLAKFVDLLISNISAKNQSLGGVIEQRIAEKRIQFEYLQREIEKLENDRGIVGHEEEIINAAAHDYFAKLSSVFEGEELADLFQHRLNSKFNPSPATTAKKPVEKLELVAVKPNNDAQIVLVEGVLDSSGLTGMEIARQIAKKDASAIEINPETKREVMAKWIKPCLDWLISQNRCVGDGAGKGKTYRLPR